MPPPRTIRAAGLTGFPETARAFGVDPLKMLDVVGIPHSAFTDPDMRISHMAARDLMELGGQVVEDFALQMDTRRTDSAMGALAVIAREQPTVRGVIEAIDRHHALHVDDTTVPIEDRGDLSIIGYVQSWLVPAPDRQCVELGMAQLIRVLRQHLGDDWRPVSVSFTYHPPKALESHRRVFGSNLSFGQDFNGIVCRRHDLDRPTPFATRAAARRVERFLDVHGGAEGPGPAERVREAVLRQFAEGGCDAERTARLLGMDLRTLQRQLAASGTTFGRIVQETRMGLVPQYLDASDLSLAEISERLGFSALSAFSRWHRTHYGVSPSVHRRAVRAEARRRPGTNGPR